MQTNAAQDYSRHYSSQYSEFNDVLITGIEAEALKYYGSIEAYKNALLNELARLKSRVQEDVIEHIMHNIHTVRYNEHTLITLELTADKPRYFDTKLFVRHDSQNVEVIPGSKEFEDILAAFYTTQNTGTTHLFS